MRILLIDNYDSFTFNLVHYLEGLDYDVDVSRTNDLKSANYKAYSHFIISPGPGLPKDYPALKTFLIENINKKPVLGVCLGLQFIGEFLNGELYNLGTVRHGISRKIKIIESSMIFKDLNKEFKVGLYHSWGLKNNKKSDFIVTAVDEEGTIMALENVGKKLYGVQFHPESILTENGKKILANFLQLS